MPTSNQNPNNRKCPISKKTLRRESVYSGGPATQVGRKTRPRAQEAQDREPTFAEGKLERADKVGTPCPEQDSNLHALERTADFKSAASTSFAIRARNTEARTPIGTLQPSQPECLFRAGSDTAPSSILVPHVSTY